MLEFSLCINVGTCNVVASGAAVERWSLQGDFEKLTYWWAVSMKRNHDHHSLSSSASAFLVSGDQILYDIP